MKKQTKLFLKVLKIEDQSKFKLNAKRDSQIYSQRTIRHI